MKRYSVVLINLLLISLCAVAVAQDPQNNTPQTTQDQAMKSQVGRVVSVDTSKNEITVNDEQNNNKTLQISSTTKITKGGREITLVDIKSGDRVLFEYDNVAGSSTVKSIVVMPAKSAKK